MEQLLDIEDIIKTPDLNGRYGDCIKIEGFVEIINGDKKLKFKNKFVNPMLSWAINMLVVSTMTYASPGAQFSTYNWDMYLGTDQTTATAAGTTALTSPIGTAPGTAPNSKSGSTSNPSTGVYRSIYTCTWNAGTVSGTVGEMALYLQVYSTLQSFGYTHGYNWHGTKQLVSRLAVADTTLTAFTINVALPLAINWTIQFSFS